MISPVTAKANAVWEKEAPASVETVYPLNNIQAIAPPNNPPIVSSYKASILSFVSVAKAWGVTPILMTQFNRVNEKDKLFRKSFKKVATPGNYDAEILQYVSAYNKFNQIKRDIAKAENIPLIDLDRLVPSTSKYIYDSIHLNEVGSEYVGQIISDFFEKEIVKSSVTAD